MDGGNLHFDFPEPARPPKPRRRNRASRNPAGRPQPVRDAILAYLVDAHSVADVAAHIERRTSTATGHLRAMYRKGLVVRLAWGVWIRRDKCRNPPDQAAITRNCPVQDALLRHMQQPATLNDLERRTGTPRPTLRTLINLMLARGVITHRPEDEAFVATTAR